MSPVDLVQLEEIISDDISLHVLHIISETFILVLWMKTHYVAIIQRKLVSNPVYLAKQGFISQ